MAEDGFLSRWSRRKLAEKEREEADAPEISLENAAQDVPAEDADIAEPAEAGEGGDHPVEAERERHPAEDIDIESLTKDSDFSVFMQKAVPVALRRQALRKLWTSDPVLANLDGLNDYEDMERVYGISTVAKTDWKLGRGFLSDKDLGLEPEPEEGAEPAEPVAEAEQPDAVEDEADAAVAEVEPDAGEDPSAPDDETDSRQV